MNDDLLNDEARALNQLLDEKRVEALTWSDTEYRSMLTHQLSVELATDLIPVVNGAEATLTMEATVTQHPPRTFGEVLASPAPPLSLLRLIKDFAKDLRYAKNNAVPDDLLLVLYFAAIIAARIRCRVPISSLDDHEVREGCSWALSRDWLIPEIRCLFEEGLASFPP